MPEFSIQSIRQTEAQWGGPIARLVAGLPLLLIGVQHLTGAAPLEPILRGTPIPFPELNALAASIMEPVAALLLLSGGFARIGGLLGLGAMAGAFVSHLTFEAYERIDGSVFAWPDEPSIALPIGVTVACLYVLFAGGGKFSLDLGRN